MNILRAQIIPNLSKNITSIVVLKIKNILLTEHLPHNCKHRYSNETERANYKTFMLISKIDLFMSLYL